METANHFSLSLFFFNSQQQTGLFSTFLARTTPREKNKILRHLRLLLSLHCIGLLVSTSIFGDYSVYIKYNTLFGKLQIVSPLGTIKEGLYPSSRRSCRSYYHYLFSYCEIRPTVYMTYGIHENTIRLTILRSNCSDQKARFDWRRLCSSNQRS